MEKLERPFDVLGVDGAPQGFDAKVVELEALLQSMPPPVLCVP
jgi:hypothetical protein